MPPGFLTNLSTAEIQRRIDELGPWFHNLEIGGVWTAPQHFLGDYPRVKWNSFRRVVPDDLRGKTVLDIGCNAGFYALEMKRRGAERVVAIDSDARYLAQAQFAAEVSGLAIEFHQLSVYEVAKLGEQFDLVIFMGVLYHLRHPLLALDLIHRYVARDLLLFQSMQRGSQTVPALQPDYPFEETAIFDDARYPCAYFVEQQYCGDWTNWWIPNRAGAEALLRSSGFTILEHPEFEVYLCQRRVFEPFYEPQLPIL